jgi:predicted RNA-binding protein with PUA-like domain
MIHESLKDYETGKILMTHDGDTTTQDVCDYLARNHKQDVNEGDQLCFTKSSKHRGLINPATIVFSPANDEVCQPEGEINL